MSDLGPLESYSFWLKCWPLELLLKVKVETARVPALLKFLNHKEQRKSSQTKCAQWGGGPELREGKLSP